MGRIEHVTEIEAPIEACYRALTQFESYPDFIRHVECVRQKGDPGVWHWEVKGPDGNLLEWDIELDALKHNNQIISWHSVREAHISNSGAITLESLTNNRTRLKLVIQYEPMVPEVSEWESQHPDLNQKILVESLTLLKQMVERQYQNISADAIRHIET